MEKGDILTVIDTSNYSGSEERPFKATFDRYSYDYEDFCLWVVSSVTGKRYELYKPQILEFLTDKELNDFYGHDREYYINLL